MGVKFRPHADVVIVEVDKESEQTESGIYKPLGAIEEKNEGIVVAKGPGKIYKQNGDLIPLRVCVDDRIMWTRGSGTKVTLNGKDYRIIREQDMLGIFC